MGWLPGANHPLFADEGESFFDTFDYFTGYDPSKSINWHKERSLATNKIIQPAVSFTMFLANRPSNLYAIALIPCPI
jgi:hypothetical protein